MPRASIVLVGGRYAYPLDGLVWMGRVAGIDCWEREYLRVSARACRKRDADIKQLWWVPELQPRRVFALCPFHWDRRSLTRRLVYESIRPYGRSHCHDIPASGYDGVVTHHPHILVLQDVAVVHEGAGEVMKLQQQLDTLAWHQ
jgi:hypothetical protein